MSLLTISGFRAGNLLLAFSSKAGVLARIRAFPFIRLPVRAFPFIRLPVSPDFRFLSSHLYICACEGTPSLSLWLRAACFILVFRHRRCKQQASHGFASGRLAMNAPRGARPEGLAFDILRWLRLCYQLRLGGGFSHKRG
jgi:hypothetical protein